MHKETSQVSQTSELDEDLQAGFTVLLVWTTQNLFKTHMCNNDCITWIRQSSRVLRDCEERSTFRQTVDSMALYLQCWVTKLVPELT